MYKQREKIIVLFSLLLLLGGVIPGQAQKDNRFEVSKNLDIFNALVKEVEMFYVDSVDVEKTVRSRKGLLAKGLKTRAPKKASSKYIIERRKK